MRHRECPGKEQLRGLHQWETELGRHLEHINGLEPQIKRTVFCYCGIWEDKLDNGMFTESGGGGLKHEDQLSSSSRR